MHFLHFGVLIDRVAVASGMTAQTSCKRGTLVQRFVNNSPPSSMPILTYRSTQIYVCGSRKMATAVKEKLTAVVQEVTQTDAATAAEKFTRLVTDRFATDVFE